MEEHIHPVVDDDPNFSIDTRTRAITLVSSETLMLIQGDHNSEKFTFEMPRYVDGHDMSLCDRVQVHFINVDGENPELYSADIYSVDDLEVINENVVRYTWLISQTATTHPGTLNFAIRFACTKDSEITYVWNTASYTGVLVVKSVDSAPAIVKTYGNILDEWYDTFLSAGATGVQMVNDAIPGAIEQVLTDSRDRFTAELLTDELDAIIVQETGYRTDKVMSQNAVHNAMLNMQQDIDSAKGETIAEVAALTSELQNKVLKYANENPGSSIRYTKLKPSTAWPYKFELHTGYKYRVYGEKTNGEWDIDVTYTNGDRSVEYSLPSNLYSEYVDCHTTYDSTANKILLYCDGNVYPYLSQWTTMDAKWYITGATKVYQIEEDVEYTEFKVNANGIRTIVENGGDLTRTSYDIIFDNGEVVTFEVNHGIGIISVERTDRGDREDTYTAYFTDGSSMTFKIPNAGAVGARKTVTGETIKVDDILPIEHVVKVDAENKNIIQLADSPDVMMNGTVVEIDPSAGSVIVDATPSSGFDIPISPDGWGGVSLSGTYTMTIGTALPKGSYFWIKDSAGTKTQLATYRADGSTTKTIELNGHYTEFGMWISVDGVFANHTFRPMLEKGATATDFVTHVPTADMRITACGKNLLKQPYDTTTKMFNGITIAENEDGSFVANGTATAECVWFLMDGTNEYLKGKYTFSGITGGSATTYYAQIVVDGVYGPAITDPVTFDFDGNLTRVGFYIKNGTTLSNATFKLQLEKGDTATEYEPYTGKTYTPNYNGSVSNVVSVSPTMNLLSSHKGVNIKAEYIRDINALFASLEQRIRDLETALAQANG